eukprot:COSAG01_NODE_7046_length_3377_cov_4.561853_2_plen_138_part_00
MSLYCRAPARGLRVGAAVTLDGPVLALCARRAAGSVALLDAMLKFVPSARITIEEALRSRFLRQPLPPGVPGGGGGHSVAELVERWLRSCGMGPEEAVAATAAGEVCRCCAVCDGRSTPPQRPAVGWPWQWLMGSNG